MVGEIKKIIEHITLPDITFVIYAILVIMMLEIYKDERELYTQSADENIMTVTSQPKQPETHGYLERSMWKQANYGGQSTTPIPGTSSMDPIENSYSQTTTLTLANPFIREEACFPIEGNIGMRIELATEIFGPFERTFLI